MYNMYDDLQEILFSREQIAEKVAELAKQLDEEYEGKNPLFVCILKGSSLFFADLIREMKIPLQIDFMAISSYGAGSTASGQIKMNKDLDKSIYLGAFDNGTRYGLSRTSAHRHCGGYYALLWHDRENQEQCNRALLGAWC